MGSPEPFPARGLSRSRSFVAAGCAALALFAFGCSAGSPEPPRDGTGRLDVVATTGMIADAARRIGGEDAAVTGLMGPGIDPHLYTASRADQRRLIEADLVLYHGLHLEGKMVDFLKRLAEEKRPGRHVAAVAEAVPEDKLIRNPAFGEYPDPHVWFDLELWAIVVREIQRAFETRDPPRAEAYRRRAETYLREIETTHRWGLETAATLPRERRHLVTSHDAFNYFGRAYGFEVRGLQGISTVSQAGLKDIEEAVKYIRAHKIPVIFAETSVSPAAIERVARSAGCRVSKYKLYSDALGEPGTPEETLLGVFRYNMRVIVEELGSGTAG